MLLSHSCCRLVGSRTHSQAVATCECWLRSGAQCCYTLLHSHMIPEVFEHGGLALHLYTQSVVVIYCMFCVCAECWALV